MLQITFSKPLFFFSIPLEKIRKPGDFSCFQGAQKGTSGNKAKGRISKRVSQKSNARIIFQRTNISYPLIRTHTFPYKGKGVRNVNFSKHFAYFYIDNTKSFSSTSGNAILLGSFIQYVHKIFRKTNTTYPQIRTRTYAYQTGCVRNIDFSKNFGCQVTFQVFHLRYKIFLQT